MWNFSPRRCRARRKQKTCQWTLETSLFYVPALICLLITGFCHLSRSRNEEKCRVKMLRRNVTARHGLWEIECDECWSEERLAEFLQKAHLSEFCNRISDGVNMLVGWSLSSYRVDDVNEPCANSIECWICNYMNVSNNNWRTSIEQMFSEISWSNDIRN